MQRCNYKVLRRLLLGLMATLSGCGAADDLGRAAGRLSRPASTKVDEATGALSKADEVFRTVPAAPMTFEDKVAAWTERHSEELKDILRGSVCDVVVDALIAKKPLTMRGVTDQLASNLIQKAIPHGEALVLAREFHNMLSDKSIGPTESVGARLLALKYQYCVPPSSAGGR